MLEVHCENATILEALTARHLAAGETAPRFHASSRPPYVEAEATGRAIALARAAGAPLYVVHLSCAEALAAVRAARAEGRPVFAETCPHYLSLTDERYDAPPEEAARYVISPPLRQAGQPAALWQGLADGDLGSRRDRPRPGPAWRSRSRAWRSSFDRISNGGPGIETLLPVVYSEGVAAGRISLERMVDLLATTPARLFGLRAKGAIEVGKRRRPRPVRSGRPTDAAGGRPPSHQRLHAVRGVLRSAGAVRSTIVRGAFVVRDGAFVGRRGFGRFVERELEPLA